MTRTRGLALLVTAALLMPLLFANKGNAERAETSKVVVSATRATEPATPPQDAAASVREINPAVLRSLGISRQPGKVDPAEVQLRSAQALAGDPSPRITKLSPEPGTNAHAIKIPEGARSAKRFPQAAISSGPSVVASSGLPATLNPDGALSAGFITNLGGQNTQLSEVQLLADWDGREDMTADRSAKIDDFLAVPSLNITRSAVSEVTVANGHLLNLYYYGDSVGNYYTSADIVGDSLQDVRFAVNIPALVNTGSSPGFLLKNPTPSDCADPTMTVTGIAVNPVADLGDFDAIFCNITGEVIYVSTLETAGCALNGSGQPIRTRIFAFATFNIGGTVFIAAPVIQIARTSVENTGGLAVDDDGSLYFHLVDLTSVNPGTGVGGQGGAIFKATELPRTVCATASRINRVITEIPGLSGSTTATLSQTGPVANSGVRLTNYSGASAAFGNISSLTTGQNNVVYAATAASNTGAADPTQGLFKAPGEFPGGLPSMITSFADVNGAFDSCSSPGAEGAIPTGDGIADPAGAGTTLRWRAFVLGNGPDVRTASAPLASVTGTADNTLKLSLQVDPTIYSGIAVNEEGSVFVISGGTPSGVGNNPSPSFTEVLGFEDKIPADRRADYVDFRGDNPPAPPASGGNVGDGDSDRFDHIYYQAPDDVATLTPVGISGLARGFLRYTNRLAPTALGTGITLGVTGGQGVQTDNSTTEGPILFETLDPSHQVAGGDDQNAPNFGDDNDGAGNPVLVGPSLGGFEFSFGGPVGVPGSIWNGFFLNANGNITFGAGDTDNVPQVTDLREGLPRIAGAWADLNPSARSINFGTFPVQAMGFSNVNTFKIRYINVPAFGAEVCTGTGGGASNTFSITLSDDGTGRDENEAQALDPADPTGDNVDPAFDEKEGPTDLRWVREPNTSTLVGEAPRVEETGHFVFDYGRMDLIGRAEEPVITGYSIGGLAGTNPPGLCEVDLGEAAKLAATSPFAPIQGQTGGIAPHLIGEGTEVVVYELFNAGIVGSPGVFASVDFDLRAVGNDPASSTPSQQDPSGNPTDISHDRIGFYGAAAMPPPNPIIHSVLLDPFVTTPTTTGLINSFAPVRVNLVGSGFFPNEVTTVCETNQPECSAPPCVPTLRPGKTVSTAVSLAIDTNADAIVDATVFLTSVTPVNRNLVRATLTPLGSAPGTAFPFAAGGGPGTFSLTTTFTAGDNNLFGPFTRTATAPIATGVRAPIVVSVAAVSGTCGGPQELEITGANFLHPTAGPITSVFARQVDNPANQVNATSFAVVNNGLINATFDFGAANVGKQFLMFVTGPGGTSRNVLTVPAGAPPTAPPGNEQGAHVVYTCAGSNSLVFSNLNINGTEGCSALNVTVSRLNPTAGIVTVDYSTSDGSATQKGDYEAAVGKLTFGPGESSKSIPIFINEDSFVEGNETFNLTLSNPTGGGLIGAPSSVTIVDDDTGSSINPIDDAGNFVCQHYHDFLNRQPDGGGLAFWTNEITSCGADPDCIKLKRINVSAAFFLSIEFQETGFYVLRAQRSAFGSRSISPATRYPYLSFLRDGQQVGKGVVVGQAGAEALLEANKQAYAEQIVTSAAFVAAYPVSQTAAQFVDALFTTAGVTPTAAERSDAIAAFGAGGTSGRVAAFRKVTDTTSLRNAEFNPAFVLMQYYGYLRRNPTDLPDIDDAGYQFWLTKLNAFNGNFIHAGMVEAFITSIEYRQRFGP